MIRCSTVRGIGQASAGTWPAASGFTTPSLGNTGVFGPVEVLNSYWFIKSDHLGKVSVGQQSSAGDNAAILVDGSGSLVPANWVMFDNAGFFIRNKVTGRLLSWRKLGRPWQLLPVGPEDWWRLRSHPDQRRSL